MAVGVIEAREQGNQECISSTPEAVAEAELTVTLYLHGTEDVGSSRKVCQYCYRGEELRVGLGGGGGGGGERGPLMMTEGEHHEGSPKGVVHDGGTRPGQSRDPQCKRQAPRVTTEEMQIETTVARFGWQPPCVTGLRWPASHVEDASSVVLEHMSCQHVQHEHGDISGVWYISTPHNCQWGSRDPLRTAEAPHGTTEPASGTAEPPADGA